MATGALGMVGLELLYIGAHLPDLVRSQRRQPGNETVLAVGGDDIGQIRWHAGSPYHALPC